MGSTHWWVYDAWGARWLAVSPEAAAEYCTKGGRVRLASMSDLMAPAPGTEGAEAQP